MEHLATGYSQESAFAILDTSQYQREHYGSRSRQTSQKRTNQTSSKAYPRVRFPSRSHAKYVATDREDHTPAKTPESQRDDYSYDFATYHPETGRNPRALLRLLRTAIIIAACVGLIAFSGWRVLVGTVLNNSTHESDTSVASPSTPTTEWRQGTLPYLYQTDPAWSQTPYAGSTIGVAGCGPTCLSMVAVSLTGRRDLDPKSMAAFAETNGYLIDGLTSWELLTSGAAQLGIAGEVIPANAATINRLLTSGYPIIASMGPGDFTSEGHFIVLAGVADDGHSIVVHDPNSPERSAQTWNIDTILSQCVNLWAFSLA